MKKVIVGIFISTLSVSAFAAELMSKADFAKVKDEYTKVGTITTSDEMAPSDARKELEKKAEEKGGDIFVVTSAETKDKIHGTAEVYKKK
ncbi:MULTISPECIES: DUF1471 family periplasmic protein YahO [unclassified Enterobacter]|uniref:DUF1471 family periplasmic protein YahO n=1 Tax=unclassified Enterobacter TaxID=2608935 RepID=UPI0008EC6BFE|nr:MULTISPECIES: DUF1471 family periplasmic protein YahO [unclassified Enterobacter]SFQ96297.1 Protein of unknown function [Enterobacter sp. kpr-6]